MTEAYEQLEIEFGEWAEVDNVVACSSGTSALQLAFEALEIPKDSTILIPEFCMIACARAATMAGLKVATVDCDSQTLNMDPVQLERVIHQFEHHGIKIGAVLLVHTYGRRCEEYLFTICNQFKLPVIEDLAEAHGVHPDSRSVAACWSFYKNKIIHGEEGGAVAFSDPLVANRARLLRSMGFNYSHDFVHMPGGFNARMSNAHAELILRSLDLADANLELRSRNAIRYTEAIAKINQDWLMPGRDVNWVYDLRIPAADVVVRRLQMRGLSGARMAFKPISEQPEYRSCGIYNKTTAFLVSRRVLYLPCLPTLSPADIDETVKTLVAVAG